MKHHAMKYLAEKYISEQTGLRRGVLTLTEDLPGLMEFTFPVRLMEGSVDRLTNSQTTWYSHWFDLTPHEIAYTYCLDRNRAIVVKHIFGGWKARIQLIDKRDQ